MCTIRGVAGSFLLATFFSVNICLGAAATGKTSAAVITLISPIQTAEIIMQTATEAIISTSVGVYALNIPGGNIIMVSTETITNDGVSAFTIRDSSDNGDLSQIIQALVMSGGRLTLGSVGNSGQVLHITILNDFSEEDGAIVYATVAYN